MSEIEANPGKSRRKKAAPDQPPSPKRRPRAKTTRKAVAKVDPKRIPRLRAISTQKAEVTPQSRGTQAAPLGTSQQIPPEVITATRADTIEPPLGADSFEQLTSLLNDSVDFSTTIDQQATDVAGLGWHLDPVNQDQQIDPGELEAAVRFLESPNPAQTLGDIFKQTYMDFGTIGNGWIELLRENDDPNGLPVGLVHAPGIMMRIRSNLYGYVMLSIDTSKVAYFRPLFSDANDERAKGKNGETLNEMLYFRRYHPGSPWYGVPRIVPAIRAIKGSLYASERNIRYFLNKALPDWLVLVTGKTDSINEDEMTAFMRDIENHLLNVCKGDDYRTLVMEVPAGIEVDMKKVSVDVEDASHIQYTETNSDLILRANAMMPNRVGKIESGNIGGGTGETQIEIYKNSTVKPAQEMFERQINAILHADRPKGLGLKTLLFKFDEIDSIDEKREADVAGIIAGTGWMTVNEGRAYMSQFLKTKLDPIDEPWADLPIQLVIPQLAAFEEFQSLQEEPGIPAPGSSTFGTPLPTTPAQAALFGKRPRMATDRGYERLAAAQLVRTSRNGG